MNLLTDFQEQLVLGTLLGDGCLSLHGSSKNARYQAAHGGPQRAYCTHKAQALFNWLTPAGLHERKNSGYGDISVLFRTRSHPIFTNLYHLCYPGRVKTVTPAWLDLLTPTALAYFVQDDGSCDGGSLRLHTEGFPAEQNTLLANWLTSRGYVASVYPSKGKYTYVGLRREGARKLVKDIAPWVVPEMVYKLRVAEELPILTCARCGTAFQAMGNQASEWTKYPVCRDPACLRWQSNQRNEEYINKGQNRQRKNARQRKSYATDLLVNRERERRKASRYRADPEKREAMNTRRREWRRKRREQGLPRV